MNEETINHPLNYPVSKLPTANSVKFALANDTVKACIDQLQTSNIGSLVILSEDQTVQGIFTERDYLMKIAGKEKDFLEKEISHFMTPNPKTVQQSDPIKKAAFTMRLGKFRHIIVTDEEGKLKSILSIKDIMDWLIDYQ